MTVIPAVTTPHVAGRFTSISRHITGGLLSEHIDLPLFRAQSCTTFPKDCKTPSSRPKLSAREIGLRLGRDQGRPKFFLTGTTAAVLFSGKAVGRAAAM